MFVCVSPNPAIDRRLRLTRLVPGCVNRATEVHPAPGGKATHVAMVLRALGADPLWIGFAGGATGQELLEGLRRIGIKANAVTVQQATRVNLEIIDDSASVTEILEPGAAPSGAEIASFLDACESAFAQGWKGASAGLSSRARSIKCDLYSPYKLSCSWTSQIPERSGLPSGVFGTEAARFGLPSAVRGIPAVG